MGREMAEEKVLRPGFDGREHEYCPYDETSKAYDRTRAPLGANVFLGSLAQTGWGLQDQDVLDVGCGTGTFLRAVRDKVGSISGMDYNGAMLEQAGINLGEGPTLKQGSADSLPFEDERFHACSMNQVIHHFPRDENYAFLKKSFEEAFRTLKPGGVLHVNTSAPEQQRDAFWWSSLFPRATRLMMARFPPLGLVKAYMRGAGLVVDSDSVCVPLERALIAEDKYLERGVMGAFDADYRDGDSSWAMAENCGELEEGLRAIQGMLDAGTADAWLAEREELRKRVGQATFITARKPPGAPPPP